MPPRACVAGPHDGLDDLAVKRKSHLCALQQMCDSDYCSGGGGHVPECSRQSAPVNARTFGTSSHVKQTRQRASRRTNRGWGLKCEWEFGCPITPSRPHLCAFHHINPNLFPVKPTLMTFECGIKIWRNGIDWIWVLFEGFSNRLTALRHAA